MNPLANMQLAQRRVFGRRRAPMLMSVTFVLLLLGGYVLFQASDVIFGPDLAVEEPQNGAAVAGEVRIRGTTEPKILVNVNGFQIQSDEMGVFDEILYLERGPYELQVVVENRFGKQARVTRQIMVK